MSILQQSGPFQCWRLACWSLDYTMWTFSRSEGPWTKQRTFFQPFKRATLLTEPCRPQISFFFQPSFICVIFVPAFMKYSIVSSAACNAWPFFRAFCLFSHHLLWKIKLANEISKRKLEQLLCEPKKKFFSFDSKILPPLFVFWTTLNCFGKTVAFIFFQGMAINRV